MFKIVVYKQKVSRKEDKQVKRYDLLDTDKYLQGIEKVQVSDINTFKHTDNVLADTSITFCDITLSEIKCSLNDVDTIKINGFFEVVFICITDKGVYKNMYIVRKNKLGMLTYDKVNSHALVTKKGVIL